MNKRINRTWAFLLAVSLLFLVEAKGEEALTKLKVVTEQANIRLKPYIGSIIIKQIPQGTTLESTTKEGEWYLVKFESDEGDLVSGYVHESMVIVLEAPPREKEEKEIIKEEEEKIEEIPLPQPVVPKAPSLKPSKSLFELCFFGGGSYISGGDLNEGAMGLADYRSDLLAIQPNGAVKPAHLSYIMGAELIIPLSSRLQLGIGVDYFRGEKESMVQFQEDSYTETLTTHPKMEALPIRLVISYYPFHYVYAKIGVEYYFAKCAYFYGIQRAVSWEEWRGEAEAQDFGILGGLGFELRLSSVFSFIIEATGRYAKITGFKGKDRSEDSEGEHHTEEGKLYFYQVETSPQDSYPLLFIKENKPTEANIFDPREAIIDFSGLSLKTGFKIKF